MEYLGFNIGCKSSPKEDQILARKDFKDIELSLCYKFCTNGFYVNNSKRLKEIRKKFSLVYYIHAPYRWWKVFKNQSIDLYIRKTIEVARSLNSKIIVFHPPLNYEEENWVNPCGIEINLTAETVREYRNPEIMLNYLNTHGLDGITFDTAHVYRHSKNSKKFIEDFKIMLPYIKHIHINDLNDKKDHVTLGEGKIGKKTWKKFLKILDDHNYGGALIIEVDEIKNEKGVIDWKNISNANKSKEYIYKLINEIKE